MGMPRFFRNAPCSSEALNRMAEEIDYQGLACKVYRSSPMIVSPNTDRIITWQVEDYDTLGGGMWDPNFPDYVISRIDGVYLIDFQERWSYPTAGSPYNTGQRAGKVLINSTNVFSTDPSAGPILSDKESWSIDGEGVTIGRTTTARLRAGDRVYTNYWHSASSTIECLHQDFGGTYLAVSRKSALT